jgi:predicted transposase/invertase (TIGR01784 family)
MHFWIEFLFVSCFLSNISNNFLLEFPISTLVSITSIEQQFEQAMQSVSTFFKEEKDFLYKKGKQKGLEKGIKKGIEQGIEKAQAKALEAKKEIARNFKNLGVSIADIAKGIGLSEEEIEAL